MVLGAQCFIEMNFTIECLNNDTSLKHIMLKVMQVGNNEVEIRLEKNDSQHPMGFKELLYDYCSFSVWEQKGAAVYLFSSRHPKDEEAILYIPLLPQATKSSRKVLKPGKAIYREKTGACMCVIGASKSLWSYYDVLIVVLHSTATRSARLVTGSSIDCGTIRQERKCTKL